jgi:hypothetical protein
MTDFNLNIDDFENSAAFSQKLGESYNPEGMSSLVTSSSKQRYEDQTLTSRDVVDIMSGRSLE